MSKKIYSGAVIKGLGNGKSKAFATVNLSPTILPAQLKQGVYAAWVFAAGQKYQGALFFGPRKILSEEKNVLEIHILDFSADLYGQEIEFSLEDFIRPVRDFSSFADLKAQIALDIQAVKQALPLLSPSH